MSFIVWRLMRCASRRGRRASRTGRCGAARRIGTWCPTRRACRPTWDVKTGKNIKWVAALGSQSYGNPVVAGGVVLVGTNNEAMRDPKQPGDRGVLMAFREATGEFMWQATFEKLTSGRANDWPFQGIASSPLIIGEKAYFMSNRAVAASPWTSAAFTTTRTTGRSRTRSSTGKTDLDILWTFDTMEEVGNFPHNLANSSPVASRQPDLHLHRQRAGREPREHPVAEGAGDRRDRHDDRRSWCGKTRRPATRSCTASGRRRRSARSAAWCRSCTARATAGCAATKRRPARSSGSSTRIPKDSVWPKTRNEVIATPVIFDERRLHRERPGSRTRRRRRPPVRHRRDQARRHHDRPGRIWHYDERSAGRFPRRRSRTASSTTRTSAASCTRSTSRPASRSGCTTCSRRCGARRWWPTARCIWATRTATSS